MSKHYNWVVDAGSDSARGFRVVDANGDPIDVKSYTARMQVRPYLSSKTVSDDLTTENGRISMGNDGVVTAILTHTATASYPFCEGVYDMEVVSPNGDVTRVVEGRMIVRKEVTRE